MPIPTPYHPPPYVPGGGGSSETGPVETVFKIGLLGFFAFFIGSIVGLLAATLVHQFRRGKQLGSGPEGFVIVFGWMAGGAYSFWWLWTH